MRTLSDLKIPVTINMMPNEIEHPIAFDRDQGHRSFDREYAKRFGAFSCKVIAFSRSSGRASAGSAVQCTFSGVALTLP
jgi:hypothetical protein